MIFFKTKIFGWATERESWKTAKVKTIDEADLLAEKHSVLTFKAEAKKVERAMSSKFQNFILNCPIWYHKEFFAIGADLTLMWFPTMKKIQQLLSKWIENHQIKRNKLQNENLTADQTQV